jgi:ABC-type phosphate/phosphonate transport system substrate-binding protein
MRSMMLIALLMLPALAGCAGTDNTLRLAFVTTDDDASSSKDPTKLARFIEDETGRKTTLVWVADTSAVFSAMQAGQADAAFVDGAAGWFAWKRFGFEAVAADQNSDGRTHYVAAAWVRADSPYQSMADLKGQRSCHTGLLKSAGMFMPLGWLIGNGLVQVQGDPNDLASIRPTVASYFDDPVIPETGAPYSGYDGALQCLSEGVGEVAFVKDTTPASYCSSSPRTWCIPDGYRQLQAFGEVPSHPVMVRDMDAAKKADLVNGLMALNERGTDLLKEVLETPGITQVTSESHLGPYGRTIENVPGIQVYVEGELKK